LSEFQAESNASSGSCSAPSGEGLRWRARPCAKCSGGVTAISQLRGGSSTSAVVPAPTPEEFIAGQKPTQDAVDSFLIEAGLTAVKQKFWLWKKTYPQFEIWLGDAREDNFVETEAGIVPIDIRLWFSSLPSFTEFSEW
jgi:hypothetical protein